MVIQRLWPEDRDKRRVDLLLEAVQFVPKRIVPVVEFNLLEFSQAFLSFGIAASICWADRFAGCGGGSGVLRLAILRFAAVHRRVCP